MYNQHTRTYITPHLRNCLPKMFSNLINPALDELTRINLWKTIRHLSTSHHRLRLKDTHEMDFNRNCLTLDVLRALGWDSRHELNTRSIIEIIQSLLHVDMQLRVTKPNSGELSSVSIEWLQPVINTVIRIRKNRKPYDLSDLVDFVTGEKPTRRLEAARRVKVRKSIKTNNQLRIDEISKLRSVSEEDNRWLAALNQYGFWDKHSEQTQAIALHLLDIFNWDDTNPKDIYSQQVLLDIAEYGALSCYAPTPHSPRFFNTSLLSFDRLSGQLRDYAFTLLDATATKVDLCSCHIAAAVTLWDADMKVTEKHLGDGSQYWGNHLKELPGFEKSDDKKAALPIIYGGGKTLLKKRLESKYNIYMRDASVKELIAGQKGMFKFIEENSGISDLSGKWISRSENSAPSCLAQMMQSTERALLNPTISVWGSRRNSIQLVSWLHDGFIIIGGSQAEVDQGVKQMKKLVTKACKTYCINTQLKPELLKDKEYPDLERLRKPEPEPITITPEEQEIQDLVDYDEALKGELDTTTTDGQLREIRALSRNVLTKEPEKSSVPSTDTSRPDITT